MPECAKPNIGHLRLQGVDGYWEPWLPLSAWSRFKRDDKVVIPELRSPALSFRDFAKRNTRNPGAAR